MRYYSLISGIKISINSIKNGSLNLDASLAKEIKGSKILDPVEIRKILQNYSHYIRFGFSYFV